MSKKISEDQLAAQIVMAGHCDWYLSGADAFCICGEPLETPTVSPIPSGVTVVSWLLIEHQMDRIYPMLRSTR